MTTCSGWSAGGAIPLTSRAPMATTGSCCGWIERDNKLAFLHPEAAYAAAQRLASSQGGSLTVGVKTLWKRLDHAKLLARKDGPAHDPRDDRLSAGCA